MNQKSNRFSLTNLSYVEEMKSKLQKLDLIRNTTDAMIVQFDLHSKINTKRKTSSQQKSINSIAKKSTLQPSRRLSIQDNLSPDKFTSNMKSQEPKTRMNIGLKSDIVLNLSLKNNF